MAVEKDLPRPNLVAGVVVQVGAQTGLDVDDVAVRTDAGNFALFQAKAGLSLGKTATSDLAKALEQTVAQYLTGPLPVDGCSNRKVDPLRDALVLCTDNAAPATVRMDLKAALERTASQPPGTPLGHELTAKQYAALQVVLDHVRRLWKSSQHTSPADEQIRTFLRVLHVVTIDAQAGGPDHAASVADLSTVLRSHADATAAWKVLVDEGQSASEARGWRDRASIALALSHQGIRLTPPAEFEKDITRLRALSTTNLETMAADAELPVSGGLRITRRASARLAAEARATNVLIVGDAGAGKSAVAQEFASERAGHQDVVALFASDIADTNKVPLDGKTYHNLASLDWPKKSLADRWC
ncbi:P-loop NTPase family protein [Rhodococcus opacus]|uniref:hypothetical protein n=1 Tax=Rhodococcus opacus TaxID=37919 RepID=UPI002949B579|nr:hypothetical protein [Rhodococcus opacus]MDV6244768.1 hypothetical protein [Rhodococcus opacus]